MLHSVFFLFYLGSLLEDDMVCFCLFACSGLDGGYEIMSNALVNDQIECLWFAFPILLVRIS